MSKSHPVGKEVYAIVLDDDGAQHEITTYYNSNPFAAIEAEAAERGIRYVTTQMFQLREE